MSITALSEVILKVEWIGAFITIVILFLDLLYWAECWLHALLLHSNTSCWNFASLHSVFILLVGWCHDVKFAFGFKCCLSVHCFVTFKFCFWTELESAYRCIACDLSDLVDFFRWHLSIDFLVLIVTYSSWSGPPSWLDNVSVVNDGMLQVDGCFSLLLFMGLCPPLVTLTNWL